MNEETTIFKTQDLNQAAFMWAQPGVKLLTLEKKEDSRNNSRPTFKFVLELPCPKEVLNTLIMDYQNEKCSVEPNTFVKKQNHLRDQLRALRN